MTTSKYRGHDIEFVDNEWYFTDTKELVNKSYNTKPCGKCDKPYTPDGHDDCLGTLKGVMNACCGHGDIKETYVQFLDGSDVRGQDARDIIEILKRCR